MVCLYFLTTREQQYKTNNIAQDFAWNQCVNTALLITQYLGLLVILMEDIISLRFIECLIQSELCSCIYTAEKDKRMPRMFV